jgi:ribosomal protein L16 Arg81 hydroxylase
MRGAIAEAHFDTGKNMIAMIKGSKRYILNPPRSCKKLSIISDSRHPSYRHSVIDWSDRQQAVSYGFGDIEAIDTILREGEVLYLPSYWFHYIISLEYSVQCNSRSGQPLQDQGESDIEECIGRPVVNKKKKKKKYSNG